MENSKKIFEEILISPNHNEQIVSIICNALTSCFPEEHKRINKILNDIIQNNKKELKKECYKGLPENLPSLRALIWKINFKYFPKDINRTFSSMNFFSKPINNKIKLSPEEINNMYLLKKRCIYQDSTLVYTKGRQTNNIYDKEIHSDVLERILYIYAKINKDVGYVQGMNAILAPIYYCYCLDNTCEKENIEADTFWSFSYLMDDIKKIFQKKNDSLKGGIFDKIILLELMVSKIDKDIFNKLQKNNKIDNFYFAIKWINLFFSQQMIMPDVLRLWDIIFSEEDRYYFVYIFSLAILEYNKKDILKRDYYEIIEKLQNINLDNVEQIIKIAFNIRNLHSKEIKEILYYYDGKDKYNENRKKDIKINKINAVKDNNNNDINKIKNCKLSFSNVNNVRIPRPISSNK